jgi:hypothetical protein
MLYSELLGIGGIGKENKVGIRSKEIKEMNAGPL